jgi:capsular exopolysaccharide synthesis family protein
MDDQTTRFAIADAENSPLAWSRGSAAINSSVLTWEQAVRVLRKRRWFLALVVGGSAVAIVAIALFMRDVYKPIARLEIDPLGAGITTLHEIENPASVADQEYVDTQVQILQSDALAMRVIRSLHLDRHPEFGAQSTTAPTNAAPAPPENRNSYLREQLDLATATPAESEALRVFHQKLSVSPVRGSRLVEVSFSSHDTKLAQAVTNGLVTQFMDQNYRNRYVTTMEASAWLSSQLSDLRQRVAESNQAVSDYQRRFGLVEADDKDVPLGQLMGEMNRQLSDAQSDRIQAEASVRMIDEGRAEALPSLRDDLVYQNLLTRYAEGRSQLAQAQTVYGDENANVKKLKSESDELTSQIAAQRERVSNRARAAFEAAKSRERMMMDVREKLRGQMGDASSHLVEYRMLKNEAIANAALYNTLQARLREAGIYAGLRSGNIRIVDMAPKLNQPTGPHRGLIIALGVGSSLVVSLLLVFVWESFDNTVRIPDDIANWIQLPSLAVLPKVRIQNDSARMLTDGNANTASHQADIAYPKVFWSRMQTAEAEAIRTLRTALTVPGRTPSPQVVLVSSASAGEGKTTVALNLASVLAQGGRTCLVEGDLRRPMIESALEINPRAGLTEVLGGKQSLEEALTTVATVPGLSVLPIRDVPSNPADLLAGNKTKALIATLRERFDHIVIDSPPLLSFSDARNWASLSDAVILVSRYGRTTRRAIRRSAELLAGTGAPLLGVVLNEMDLSSPDYHYFNYGYSWSMSGRRYKDEYQRFVPPARTDSKPTEKSSSAHA